MPPDHLFSMKQPEWSSWNVIISLIKTLQWFPILLKDSQGLPLTFPWSSKLWRIKGPHLPLCPSSPTWLWSHTNIAAPSAMPSTSGPLRWLSSRSGRLLPRDQHQALLPCLLQLSVQIPWHQGGLSYPFCSQSNPCSQPWGPILLQLFFLNRFCVKRIDTCNRSHILLV